MTPDVALAKLASSETCLRRIRAVTRNDPARLEDIDVQDIVVLNLQRAIQSAIDLAAHLLATGHLGLPQSLKEHFTLLVSGGIIEPALGHRLEAMAGFRNIAVHDYQAIKPEILKHIVADRLTDLEELMNVVRRRISANTGC